MNRVILRNIINDVLYLKNLIYLKKYIYIYISLKILIYSRKETVGNKKYLIDVYIFSNIGKF